MSIDILHNPDVFNNDQITLVQIPTAEQEVQLILKYLRSKESNEKFYPGQTRLPSSPIIGRLENREINIDDTNFERELLTEYKNLYYKPDDYQKALSVYNSPDVQKSMERAYPAFKQWHNNWGFKIFPEYIVRMSRWGGGGLSDKENIIWVRTSMDGNFEIGLNSISDPAEIPTHEKVHKGIKPFIETFGDKIEKWEKESIVRSLEANMGIPEYREHTLMLRERFPTAIDKYLVDGLIIQDLPSVLKCFTDDRMEGKV